MAEGRQTMREMITAFKTKHDQIRDQLTNLQIDPEETLAVTMKGPFRHFEKGVEDDQINKGLTRTSSQGNVVNHAKLHRTRSDGFVTTLHDARRNSFCQPSPSKATLPKLPLRRLSSDITGSGRQFAQYQGAFPRMDTTRQISQQQGFHGSDFNTARIPVKRKSFPQEKALSFGSQRAQEHHLVGRRRSATCSSATRPRRPSSSTCTEAPKWRIKKHKRCLNIDDEDSDTLEDSMPRRSSSSSGFSSQSSLL